MPLFLDAQVDGPGEHLRRRAGAVRSRACSASSWCASTRATIPDELLEAARIDGASELRIFLRIVLPVLRPILVTLAVFTFLASWNDFMWPLIVLTDRDAAHAAGRARLAFARARAGHRADDGGVGGHDGCRCCCSSSCCSATTSQGLLAGEREGLNRCGLPWLRVALLAAVAAAGAARCSTTSRAAALAGRRVRGREARLRARPRRARRFASTTTSAACPATRWLRRPHAARFPADFELGCR